MSRSSLQKYVATLCTFEVIFALLYACTIAFGFHNAYRFIYQQKRYRYQPLVLWFYVLVQGACLFHLISYICAIIGNS